MNLEDQGRSWKTTWTLAEVAPAAIAVWPGASPEAASARERYRTIEVVEADPILDLLKECLDEIGTDAEGNPPRISHRICIFLRENGRLP